MKQIFLFSVDLINIFSVIHVCTGWCTYVSAHLLMYQGT